MKENDRKNKKGKERHESVLRLEEASEAASQTLPVYRVALCSPKRGSERTAFRRGN